MSGDLGVLLLLFYSLAIVTGVQLTSGRGGGRGACVLVGGGRRGT